MTNLPLIGGGALGMAVALVHGWLSQRMLLPGITGATLAHQRINAAVYHLSTLYWMAAGAALVWVGAMGAPTLQMVGGVAVGFIYASGALANVWATRGRHIGGPLLGCAAALAIAGAILSAG